MSKLPLDLSPSRAFSKIDDTNYSRELWRAAYRQSRSMIRDGGRYGYGARYVWALDHMRRRFGASGWPVVQLAARTVLDRRTACRGATGSLADLERQGLVDRAGRPVRCVNVERCRSWRIAWSVDPLADVNGRRADRAYRVRQRREIARGLAADRVAIETGRFYALTLPGLLALRAAEAARATV